MLNDLQNWLAPYLGFLGENPWLQATVVIFVSLVIAWIFDRFISALLSRATAKTPFQFDDYLVRFLRGPIYFSVILIGLVLAVNLLDIPAPYDFVLYSVIETIAWLIWILFFLRVTRTLLRYVANDDQRLPVLHPQTLPLFDNLAIILIAILGVYVVFSAWNVDMTAWLASAGIVGIAIGFAAKDTLANLFSGVFILADAPYKIGDYVVLDGGERGEVTHIGIRSTRLRTRDDVEVTVPNAIMGNTKITNESGGPYEKFRIRVAVGVAYGSDIDQVERILLEIADANEQVVEDPEARVRFRRFGNSSLDFDLLCWVEQPSLRGLVTHELLSAIYKAFNREGVEIPYSKHDLYIKEVPSSDQ